LGSISIAQKNLPKSAGPTSNNKEGRGLIVLCFFLVVGGSSSSVVDMIAMNENDQELRYKNIQKWLYFILLGQNTMSTMIAVG
jgi:hypothetical protein